MGTCGVAESCGSHGESLVDSASNAGQICSWLGKCKDMLMVRKMERHAHGQENVKKVGKYIEGYEKRRISMLGSPAMSLRSMSSGIEV
jgi:hypothetical protein